MSSRFGAHADTGRCTIVVGSVTSSSAMAASIRDLLREVMTWRRRNALRGVTSSAPPAAITPVKTA